MVKTKFNAYEKTLYEFLSDIYVVCPKCENQAIVRSKGHLRDLKEKEIKLICPTCGMNKYYSETPMDQWISERSGVKYEMRNLILGANFDPYF